jgi:hypothetical protein
LVATKPDKRLWNFRRIINILGGLMIVSIIAYLLYAFGGAEARMKKLCLEITPGMTFSELKALSQNRGVTAPQRLSGVNYLVETKSFGRWGCKVDLESGVVTHSEYLFSD